MNSTACPETPPRAQAPVTDETLKASLTRLLHSGSYNQVRERMQSGVISPELWRAYVRTREWISPWFSSTKQDAFWRNFGKAAYERKIAKTRTAFGFSPIKFQPVSSAV